MPAVQLSLLGREEPRLEHGFAQLVRTQLDRECWLDYVPGFVTGHARLFELLEQGVSWQHERRMMYEREVDVPRLVASSPVQGGSHPLIGDIARLLAQRYDAHFERIGLALYRGGSDSVAFHRDKMPRDRPTLVAIVSLGTPRRFLVRPFGGGSSRTFQLGLGDLFVMGGMCQLRWEHGVPKVRQAEPRMSLMFRHVY
jgi:alkylated DNA repair dioxygenase AlkB